MALRTYGDKPLSFQLEENGEFYYVGSEVYLFTAPAIKKTTNKSLTFTDWQLSTNVSWFIV